MDFLLSFKEQESVTVTILDKNGYFKNYIRGRITKIHKNGKVSVRCFQTGRVYVKSILNVKKLHNQV